MWLVDRGRELFAAYQKSRLRQLVRRYGDDDAGLLASVIAYNALFSLFPIMLVVLTLVGFVLRAPGIEADVQGMVVSALPAAAAGSVLDALAGTRQGAGLFGVLSLIGLLWSGSGLFGSLEVALDRIYRVPSRPFVRQKLMAVAMMVLFAVLVIAVIAATTVAGFVSRLVGALPFVGPGATPGIALVGAAVSVLAAFALCLAIYRVVPNAPLTVKHVLPGAGFAALALLFLSQVFPIYASLVGGFNQYGAIFGLFFLLMTWCYLVAQALLVGAEINALLRPVEAPGARAPAEGEREKRRPAA